MKIVDFLLHCLSYVSVFDTSDTQRIVCIYGKLHYSHLVHFLSLRCFAGQRLFRRSGLSSESFSETSSIGQVDETTREESTGVTSSIHPPTCPPALEEDLHTPSDVSPEKIQEPSEQVHTQMETEEASEKRQPEGQEVEQSTR